ncbi:conserved hypothetical protein [Histoplasma capsulatum var. duboisii H88]|uniref:Hot dog superfamily domain-containing protein n=1 Tax=Ajellomyces capsulatus (strain H88) TaxID=544711 RepID=F0UIU5_AJEC8|nr:conserved hypothetical protein [Histoplasma capsulatum var. duboisii H88]QSS56299.1 hot dog superfamily domain-containing protein [Histoplasma capsulatum var. duboisii H88]
MADGDNASPASARLADSSYLSPYSRNGAPGPHPNTDPYAPLRARALSTLEAMGFDPKTMVEHGVLWAEHQDPYGHVNHTQYMSFFSACYMRVMEFYDEFLRKEELDDIFEAKTVVPLIRKYELDFRRQVKYPDVVIAAFRHDYIELTRNNGTTVLFSLKQQAVVAQVRGSVTYMDVKTGRPVDIRTLGGGFPALYEGFVKTSEKAKLLREKWAEEHPTPQRDGKAKI